MLIITTIAVLPPNYVRLLSTRCENARHEWATERHAVINDIW